ncbi:integrator complex subunit 8 [Planococcus citri]|uniref:integrator complex subunit 8 n=1 Tax=Planococcus citri TaxID=170843 RepID=UPI0031F7BBEE
MDVELLRPGNVPISPNTILWFEFLLQPNLLEQHLKKPNPDPVPSDLLVRFLTLSVEPAAEDMLEKTKNFKCSKRHLSMKVLALKIVAYWKWNLEVIESKLPLQLQYVLLRDLLCLLSDDFDQNLLIPAMHHTLNFEMLRDEQIFAISLYHRWTLHIIINSPMLSKNVLCSTTPNVESADEIMSKIMDDEGKSELVLQKILALKKDYFVIPAFHNFAPPTEHYDLILDWPNGLRLPSDKFFCQIYYDLGNYKLYREQHAEASEYFMSCKALFDKLKMLPLDSSCDGFCEIKEDNLKGFCRACGMMLDENRNLTLEFYSAIRNNYTNIINVLQADNLRKEIPISYRDSLELDLASTLASGKFTATRDLLFQIQTLNAIRRLLEGSPYPSVMDYASKLNQSRKGVDILIKALKPLIDVISDEERQKIRLFLLTLSEKWDASSVRLISNDKDLNLLFMKNELKRTRFDNDDLHFKKKLNDEEERQAKNIKRIVTGNLQLETSALEREIIKTYDPVKLKELIVKFTSMNHGRTITSICNNWDFSNGLCKIATNLPVPFLRDYCYAALAKVTELLELKNYTTAREMIRSADEELKNHGNTTALSRFSQLLLWEKWYVDMMELLVLWPAKNINYPALLISCKKLMMTAQQGGDVSVLPRLQIMELCVLTLINLSELDYLVNTNFQKRFRYLELSYAIALACLEIKQLKGNKKFLKDCWDLIIPTFLNVNLQRKQIGQFPDRDNPTGVLNKAGLTQYFVKLRDVTVINAIFSLLARLHNILRDEPNLELYFHFTQLWPPSVPNPSAYNPEAVLEVISEMLDHVSLYQPENVQWLKLAGDVNFVKRHHSTALKYYLKALVAASDYFIRPVPKNIIEDFTYKRMVRCCMEIQCFTQAAVLCQFLDEVDYSTAFKCLSENATSDASDCYYNCIWDVNILEFLISLHTKRNQYSKKQKAIDTVGLLELNSNNNEEIKREASNVRKIRFLRAMSKQYIC